uniref:AIRS domain-containing protein n=1 Tax=Heterorhabditis bacteriophora TaxID=37862 RepID=A0A1I7X9Y2_HETBA
MVDKDTSDRINRILEGFTPKDHGLPSDFILTNLTALKGCGCKVPRTNLLELLKTFGSDMVIDNDTIGIGLDSCVVPLRQKGFYLVQTTDFFYPLVDDPYLMYPNFGDYYLKLREGLICLFQGRITCANVLSDIYAMGIVNCDNMLMLLGIVDDLNMKERDVIVSMFIQGFKDAAEIAGTRVRGGQTVRCPWLLLGGVASSVASEEEIIKVYNAQPGDVLLLTKPIGGQVAVNSYEWLKKKNGRVRELGLDENRIIRGFQQCLEQMSRMNRCLYHYSHVKCFMKDKNQKFTQIQYYRNKWLTYVVRTDVITWYDCATIRRMKPRRVQSGTLLIGQRALVLNFCSLSASNEDL